MDRIEPGGQFRHLRIEQEIGSGAFGRVYLAHDTRLDRKVALKVLSIPAGPIPEAERQRLLAEARLIAKLQSPYVVTLFRVHDLGDGGWAFEMEYMEGGSLEQLLSTGARLPLPRARSLVRDLARGLAAAHAAGIVHGDLKPGNVLLDRDGNAKLADFGLSGLLHDSSVHGSTQEGMVGTPRYMAPEIIMGGRPTVSSDIWDVGVVLYELVSGVHPFGDSNLNVVWHAILNAQPPPLPNELPRDLERLILHCLEKAPQSRPRRCEDVLRRIEGTTEVGPASRKRRPSPSAGSPVGRSPELREIEGLLDEVAAGHGRALLLTGEAGIGKSTLIHALAGEASRRGFACIQSRATPVEGILRPLLFGLRREVTGDELCKRHGSSGRLLANILADDSATFESREQVVWALERILDTLAGTKPLALLFEDVQEARPEDARLIADLATRLRQVPVFVAASYRIHDSYDSTDRQRELSRYHDLASRREFHHLELRPLLPAAILGILQQAQDCAHVEAGLAQGITGLVEGNPLFAKELLQHLVERGVVKRRASGLVAEQGWRRHALPRRIRDVMRHRLEGLAEDQRSMLDVAAVDGVEFDGDAVSAVLEKPLLWVLRTLQTLYRERGLIVPRESGYRFSHSLLQEVLYEEIAPSLRREVHRKLALHLEARPASAHTAPERLGLHWRHAGELDRARSYLIEAARAAEGRQELSRTIALCELAGLTGEQVDGALFRDYAGVFFSLASAYSGCGRHEDVERVLDNVAAAARATGNDQLRLRTVARRARLLYPVRGLAAVDPEELRRASEELPELPELAWALHTRGTVAKQSGDLVEAERLTRRAEDVAERIGFIATRAAALDQLATLARVAGRTDDAERMYREAAVISESAGRRINGAISRFNAALLTMTRGALDGLEEEFDRVTTTLTLEGATEVAARAGIIRAHFLYARGDLAGAEACAREHAAVLDTTGSLQGICVARIAQAHFRMVAGDFETGETLLEEAKKAARQCGNVHALMDALALESQGRSAAGDPAKAVDTAREAIALARVKGSPETQAEVLLWIAEATLYGLPPAVLEEAIGSLAPEEAPEDTIEGRSVSVARGLLGFATGEHGHIRVRRAGQLLIDPGFGVRRHVLTLIGRYLLAHEERCAGDAEAAQRALEQTAEAASSFGHRWLAARIATTLEERDRRRPGSG